jgi:hypothetical protein
MDLVEMTNPYLAIITASLDGYVRCFKNFKLFWSFNKHHPQKQLDYTKLNGSALLVTGFLSQFSVWDI